MREIAIEALQDAFFYDPETGRLAWKIGPRAGKEAQTMDAKGYVRVGFRGQDYLVHRVVWAMTFGSWPDKQIDHINGVRNDNRLANLRNVDGQQNAQNQKLNSKNSSGAPGVYWSKTHKKWRAYISLKRKKIWLGLFSDFDAAVDARKLAEQELRFHPNHGRRDCAPSF